MTVTEESRHRLHLRLDETIGEEEATTLMEHLPPVGWSDVATKQDLAELETRLDLRFQMLDTKIDGVDSRLDAKIDHRYHRLDAKIDHRFHMLDAKIDHRCDGLKDLIVELGKKIDGFDGRFEAQNARMDHLFWQFLGFVVAVVAMVFTAIKIFGG